jgi:hypothetical protein
MQNNQNFTHCGVQRVPIRCWPDRQWFMRPKSPHRPWLSMADRCRLFFSCGPLGPCEPLINFSFCRGGLDWVALGVMCVLYLQIDVFWAGERECQCIVTPSRRVIVLSWSYSCRDNALDGGPKHWGPAGVDVSLQWAPTPRT